MFFLFRFFTEGQHGNIVEQNETSGAWIDVLRKSFHEIGKVQSFLLTRYSNLIKSSQIKSHQLTHQSST